MAELSGKVGAIYAEIADKMIDNCDINWDNGTHGTPELDEVNYKEGTGSVKIVVADAEAGDILATNVLTSVDIRNYRRVQFWIKSSVTTQSGDLCLLIDETIACAGGPAEEVLTIPILTGGEWQLVTLVLDTASDLNEVISVGLEYNASPQDCNIWIDAVKVIGSLLSDTDEVVGTGNGAETEFALNHANVNIDTLVIKLDGTITKDYLVTVKGDITFNTAPSTAGDGIKANYTYWVVTQVGGFFNWNLNEVADVLETTDYSDSGHRTYIAALIGWTGSAEKHWMTEETSDWIGTKIIIKLYIDASDTLRYEGWGVITGHGVTSAVDTLVNESLSFQGDSVLTYEDS